MARTVRHAWLTEAILGIHAASRGTYGFRRVDAEPVLGLGIHVHHRAVELQMRRADLHGLHGLHGNRTRRPRPETPWVADLVNRDFARHARDQLWVTDVTEHPTFEGKVCCAVLHPHTHHAGTGKGERDDRPHGPYTHRRSDPGPAP